MNEQQAEKYVSIRDAYETDPRWIDADKVRRDPESSPEDFQWAVRRCASLEEYTRRSAEQARIGGRSDPTLKPCGSGLWSAVRTPTPAGCRHSEEIEMQNWSNLTDDQKLAHRQLVRQLEAQSNTASQRERDSAKWLGENQPYRSVSVERSEHAELERKAEAAHQAHIEALRRYSA